ncbi:MAG: protein-ADP-ribose hydrolase [Pseudomonadota bacterium]
MSNRPHDNLLETAPVPLDLNDYRSAILLDEPFRKPDPAPEPDSARAEIARELLSHLIAEGRAGQWGLDMSEIPSSYGEMRRMLRALLTVRAPDPLPARFNGLLDRLLQREALDRGCTDVNDLPVIAQAFPGSSYGAGDRCALWQGSIVDLRCDAVVNAANTYLLGCFQPFHACIDDVIQNAAGPRVREDCNTIMRLQRGLESTGWAKATRGYNLPARYIFHTVGPIIEGRENRVSTQQERHLSACYSSCPDLALRMSSVRSVAFCCISTGIFGFPKEPAARIALETVEKWFSDHPGTLDVVVFNVFSAGDYEIYKGLLERW